MEAAIVPPWLQVKKNYGFFVTALPLKPSGYNTLTVLHTTNKQDDYDLLFNSNNTKQLLKPFSGKSLVTSELCPNV